MVALYRIIRNMDNNIAVNDEETCREYVKTTIKHQIYFLDYMKYTEADEDRKRLVWLRLMGLIDTWYET